MCKGWPPLSDTQVNCSGRCRTISFKQIGDIGYAYGQHLLSWERFVDVWQWSGWYSFHRSPECPSRGQQCGSAQPLCWQSTSCHNRIALSSKLNVILGCNFGHICLHEWVMGRVLCGLQRSSWTTSNPEQKRFGSNRLPQRPSGAPTLVNIATVSVGRLQFVGFIDLPKRCWLMATGSAVWLLSYQ